ncbi:MAG: hypothetical protein Q9221_006395 [Calogaya cf. arnoldii]
MKQGDDRFRAPKNDAKYNRFFSAAAVGSVPILEGSYHPGINVNALQANRQRGQGALHIAAGFGDTPSLRWLLDHGADVNLRDSINETALSKAAYSAHTSAVKLLLDAGAETNLVTTQRSCTALHSVLQDKDTATPEAIETIELLLERGFRPDNGHDEDGFTLSMPQLYQLALQSSLPPSSQPVHLPPLEQLATAQLPTFPSTASPKPFPVQHARTYPYALSPASSELSSLYSLIQMTSMFKTGLDPRLYTALVNTISDAHRGPGKEDYKLLGS